MIHATSEPLLQLSPTGTVRLSFDDGETTVVFRTEAAYHAAMAKLVRMSQAWPPYRPDLTERESSVERWAEDRIEQDRAGIRPLGVR